MLRPISSASRAHLILLFIMAGALALRLIHANADFWFDEIITLQRYVRPPLPQVISTYIANNHVLNSILAHFLVAGFGEAPWVVRLPAIAFGVASVWTFWMVASDVWRLPAALLGTGLFALSYYGIYYSQNARGYSGFLFFALLATAMLLRLFRRAPDNRQRAVSIAYAIAIGGGLYAMLLQAFVVVGHATIVAAFRRWRLLIPIAAGCGGAAVLYLPMAGPLIQFYRTQPAATGYPIFSAAFLRLIPHLAVALIIGAVVCGPLTLRLARRRPEAAAVFIAPLFFTILLPLLSGQGVYPRTFIFGLPVAYFLLTEAFDYLWSRCQVLVWASAGLIAVVSMAQLVPYYRLPKQGFRQAVVYVDANCAPGDQRVGLTLAGKAAQFYDPRFELVETVDALRVHATSSSSPLWIISTFPWHLRNRTPELDQWLRHEATLEAEFPGVIGDGVVSVHRWSAHRTSRDPRPAVGAEVGLGG
jgi:hypothetical protein